MAFAFMAIKKFVGFQRNVQTNQFFQNFQNDVTKLYESNSGTNTVSYTLPSDARSVCFVNNPTENTRIITTKGIQSKQIDHLNMDAILNGKTSSCANATNGKVTFTLDLEYGGSPTVTVKF